MVNFTLDDLMNFTQNEQKMVQETLPLEEVMQMEPEDRCLRNILAYNKALSVRKNGFLQSVRLILN